MGAGRPGGRIQERLGGHEHPRRAVATLRGAFLSERDLEGMERVRTGQAFARRDLGVANERGKGQAREDRDAVNEDRAGTALAQLAAVLRTGQAELLAKDFEERVMRIRRDRSRLAVHAEGEELLRHAASAPIR